MCRFVGGDKNGRVEIALECIVEGWGESENGGGVDGIDKGVVGLFSDEDCGSGSGMRLWLEVESRVLPVGVMGGGSDGGGLACSAAESMAVRESCRAAMRRQRFSSRAS